MDELSLPVKASVEKSFSKKELMAILDEREPGQVTQLHREADQTRKEFMGDEVHIRGIIGFSNHCRKENLYCGLRKSNDQLLRYRMTLEGIFEAGREAKRLDFKTVVLRSGEDPAYTPKDLCTLVQRIKKELNLAVTLCVGERTFEEYKMFKDAGTDHYLL